MKKKLLIPITILTASLFCSCSQATSSANATINSNIQASVDSITTTTTAPQNTTDNSTTEEATTLPETTTPEPTTTPETTTEPLKEPITTFNPNISTTIAPIGMKGPIMANQFEDHGKTLNIYGDIDPNDERVKKLENTLQGYNKRISLAVWKKDGTKALSFNTQQTYFSACTIKAGYMLNVCKLIDKGVADENTLMTYQEKYYHRGSGQIRKNPYGSQYSLKTLINLALSISDNVAYKMLTAYFGHTEYNALMDELGCSSIKLSGMWASKAKVDDYIIIWNEIYEYVNSDAKMAQMLKAACTNTPFNYGTETLASGIDYSHKSGDNFGSSAVYNDAGIVWADDAYIYAVFTNSEGQSNDIKTVNTAMEIVYDIMTN